MKLGIMQPYFFPYIGYWQLFNLVDKYVIYDDVNYIKNGWINRNNILLNKNKHMLTIPLNGASPFIQINKIKITTNNNIRIKILKTIHQSYKKAPFFDDIYPRIEKILLTDTDSLNNILIKQFQMIKDYLEINTEIILSSNIKKNNNLKGKDKVLDICKILGASDYYNSIGGTHLYSKDEFIQNKINLHFLSPKEIYYKQFNNTFIPNLSFIDVLMFNSKENIKEFLNQYEVY